MSSTKQYHKAGEGVHVRRGLMFALMAMLVVGLVGCGGGGGIFEAGRVKGYVFYKVGDTGTRELVFSRALLPPSDEGYEPLRSAKVYLDGPGYYEEVTDSDGKFVFTSVKPGSYTLTVFHDYFKYGVQDTVYVEAFETNYPSSSLLLGLGYYILIGVSDYQDPLIDDLDGPTNDVMNMYRALVQGNNWSNGSVVSVILENASATKLNIQWEIQNAVSKLQRGDYLVVYFSGHGGGGLRQDTVYDFIVPYDANLSSPATLITDTELLSWIQSSETDDVTLIIDACNSGAFADGYLSPSLKAFSTTNYNTVFASKPSDSAFETPFGEEVQGVFTHFVVEGIEETRIDGTRIADTNRDHLIFLSEIVDYAGPKVLEHVDMYGDLYGEDWVQQVDYYIGNPEASYIFEY